MRELSFNDMRWVAGGLPMSGAEGEGYTENGVTYIWSGGQWTVAGDDGGGATTLDSTEVEGIVVTAASSSWDDYFDVFITDYWEDVPLPEDADDFYVNSGASGDDYVPPSMCGPATQTLVAKAGVADMQKNKTIRSAGELLTVAAEFFGFSDVGMSRTERETALAQKYDPSQITETVTDGVPTGLVNDGRTVLFDEDGDGAWDIAYTTDAAGNYKAFDINGWRDVDKN